MSRKEKRQKKKLITRNKRMYLCLLLLGNICLIASLYVYSITVISPWILVIICTLCGLIGARFDYKRYMFTYDVSGFIGHFSSFGQNALFIGGVTCLLFLKSNEYFASSELVFEEYEIIERKIYKPSGSNSTYKSKKPLFTIELNGKRKELTFEREYLDDIDSFKMVQINSKEGFWGFTVVVEKTLKK